MRHSSTGGPVEKQTGERPGLTATGTSATGRLALVVAAWFVAFQNYQSQHPLLVASVLTALLVLATLGVAGLLPRSLGVLRLDATLVTRVLVTTCVLRALLFEVSLDVAGPPALAFALALAATAFGLAVVWGLPGRLGTACLAGLLATQGALLLLVVHATPFLDDVPLYVDGALRNLLHGRFPYGESVPNPFTAADTARFIAPELLDGGRILLSFPYLPGLLFAELPGLLVGDYRYTHVLAVVLLALVWHRLAVDPAGRALAVLAVLSPFTARLVAGGWVEAPLMLGLAVLALAVSRGWQARGLLAVAFLLAGKQYVAPVVAFLVPVWRRLGARAVVGGALLAGALSLVFLAWGPSGFWHDVVQAQLLQPYRPDSISLMVALGNELGVPPDGVLTAAPLLGGFLVSTLVALRTRPGATATAAAFGLGLFATLLLSKQAFFNYYAMVEAALITAAIAWPSDGPSDRSVEETAQRTEPNPST